jgi:[ribosomal protein S5]-alanine N-acetyltransferase
MDTDPASFRLGVGLPIRTQRLTIRPLPLSDVDAMHAVYSDPEVTRFIPGGVRDIQGTRQGVVELIGDHARHGVSKWGVTLSDSSVLIGGTTDTWCGGQVGTQQLNRFGT